MTMTRGLRQLWRGVGFRLSCTVGLLVAVTMLASLGIVYMQTVGVMQGRMQRNLAALVTVQAQRFEQGGLDAVATEVERALGDRLDADSELYLLRDAAGRRVAGNLDASPVALAALPLGGGQLQIEHLGSAARAYLVGHRFGDGSWLYIGHDLRDLDSIEALIANASAAAGLVALFLLIGGIFIFRQELERSVGQIRQTAGRVAAGEMRERVPADTPDEFGLLGRDINAMLDRTQSLMDGVRHVSDTIAHNLRTPLTRVLLQLHAARDGGGLGPEAERVLDRSIEELDRLVSMSARLLQLAEVEAGTRRARFAPVLLAALADDVIDLYEAAAQEQGVRLARAPGGDDDRACVLGDRSLLAGVLVNLLDNCFVHATGATRIELGIAREGDRVLLVVRDDGAGVPAAELARLGERFHRVEPTREGHGLGLASVRAVASLHGGSLRIADARPGLLLQLDLPAHPA